MRRSLALFAVSALLPIVILGAILGTYGYHARRNAIELQAQNHARFMATLIGRELVSNMRAAQMIAQSPALDGPIDEQRFAALATRLKAIEPLWRVISVATPSGLRVVDVPRPINGIRRGSVIEIDSLREAVRTGRPTVGRGLAGRNGHIAFAVRAPVVRGGQVRYVVATVVEPKAMADLLLNANLPPDWSIELIDQAGHIVARTGSLALVGKPATPGALAAITGLPGAIYEDRTADGVNQVATWRPIPKTRWTVHVAMPASAYRAPMLRAAAVLTGGILASAALAGLFVWLLARDLKHQRQRDAAATESQRLEALGRMTGGVAHDFNNLLTPVIGGLDMLQRRLTDDSRSLRLVEAALLGAERARTLVSRLLAFSRRQTLEPRDIDIVALLEGLRDLIEKSIGDNIALIYDLPGAPLSVRVDPAQLELAILNLAVNAHDAMPAGGKLTISVEQESFAESPGSGMTAGHYVKIVVADTGVGMNKAIQAQAIEPFFTTKAVGKGTGLGLSMVHGLAAQSGGRLLLTSSPGLGTRIEIWLPTGAGPIANSALTEAIVDPRIAHLLLVDDHDLVRRATAELLREHGHIVIEARSAGEGLALLKGDSRFDAMVTDYVMPGQSGAELAFAARAFLPTLPILLITGFADLTDDLPPDIGRLAKPFRGTELLARVSAMLA